MSEVAVSRQAIDEILALSDRVERNRRITLTYWELAEQLRPVFRDNASWLSFAVWASDTAGEFIEKNGLITALAKSADPAAPPGLTVRIARGLLDLFRLTGLFDRVTDAISLHTADGNRLVFTELAHLFLDLAEVTRGTAPPDDEKSFEERLAAAPPGLRVAFGRYLSAAREVDRRVCAEHILLANLETVLHEQQRLDSIIRRALDAVVLDGLLPLLGADVLKRLPASLGSLLEIPVRLVQPALTRIAERFATDSLLTLRVRGEELKLRDDVRSEAGKAGFSPDLADPILDRDLEKFLARWDETRWGEDSGAENWAQLRDRMNYLCALFRSRQQDANVFRKPFPEAELERIEHARERVGL